MEIVESQRKVSEISTLFGNKVSKCTPPPVNKKPSLNISTLKSGNSFEKDKVTIDSKSSLKEKSSVTLKIKEVQQSLKVDSKAENNAPKPKPALKPTKSNLHANMQLNLKVLPGVDGKKENDTKSNFVKKKDNQKDCKYKEKTPNKDKIIEKGTNVDKNSGKENNIVKHRSQETNINKTYDKPPAINPRANKETAKIQTKISPNASTNEFKQNNLTKKQPQIKSCGTIISKTSNINSCLSKIVSNKTEENILQEKNIKTKLRATDTLAKKPVPELPKIKKNKKYISIKLERPKSKAPRKQAKPPNINLKTLNKLLLTYDADNNDEDSGENDGKDDDEDEDDSDDESDVSLLLEEEEEEEEEERRNRSHKETEYVCRRDGDDKSNNSRLKNNADGNEDTRNNSVDSDLVGYDEFDENGKFNEIYEDF